MAGIVVCDLCDSDRFVGAVARVSAHAIDKSTVTTMKTIDACAGHITEAVEKLWKSHNKTPNLHDIRIVKV